MDFETYRIIVFVQAGVQILLIIAGIICGIAALVYGRGVTGPGIRKPAITGLIVSLCFMALIVAGFIIGSRDR